MVYGNHKIDKKAIEFASLIKEYFIPRTDVLPVFPNEKLKQIQASTFFIGGESDCFYNSHNTASGLNENIVKVQCLALKKTGHVLIN